MGAFDDYQPPSKGGAFSDYKPPGAATSAAPVPGADPFLTQQPNEGWGGYLLRHLHGASRALDDLATFGYGDKGQGALDQTIGAGPTTAQLRSDTNTAYATNPAAVNYGLGAATYAMGPGELGLASKIGGSVAPALGKWAGGVLGSAAEGAGAGALGAAGHDEDIGQGAKWGGGLGALGGVLGGVVGGPQGQPPAGRLTPSPVMPAARSIPDLEAAKTAAYAPLKEQVFHGPSQIKPALDAVKDTMSSSEQGLAASTIAKVNKLADQGLVTGSDIQDYQKLFGGLSKSGNDVDRQYAPQFRTALEGVMQNTTPYGRNLTPGQGMNLMLPGQLGGTGLAAGEAAAARDAGNVLFGRLQDTQRIEGPEGWMAKAAAGGPDVGTQAKSWLPSEEGLKYAPGPPPGSPPGTKGSPLFEATQALGETARPDSASIPWYLKHTVLAPTAFTIGNEVANAFGVQQSPSGRLAEDLAAFPILMGGMKSYSAIGNRLNRAAQARALGPLRAAASTGQYQAPFQRQVASPLSDAIRQIIYGQGAAGRF